MSDYNWNGQAGEDFDRNLGLPNIDFVTYVGDSHVEFPIIFTIFAFVAYVPTKLVCTWSMCAVAMETDDRLGTLSS